MALLTYLIQVTSCLALLYVFFLLALQKETTFQSNRVYLLSSLLISLMIPFVKIYIDDRIAPSIVTAPTVFIGNYVAAIEETVAVTSSYDRISWMDVFFRVYVAGIILLCMRFTNEILKIYSIKKGGSQIISHGHNCILSDEVKSPFSFFNTIFLPGDHGFSSEELEEVLSHEHAHIKGRHTWEVLIVELITIGLWLSPLVYLYRQKLREIHEYLADAAVIKNTNWEKYAEFLVSQKGSGLQNHLSNQLMYSQLKNRIVMMSKKPSSPLVNIKYFGIIPLLLIAFVIFSFREKITNIEFPKVTHQDSEKNKYNLYEDGLKVQFFDNPMVFQKNDTLPTSQIIALRLPQTTENLVDANRQGEVFTYVEKMPRFVGCDHLPENEWNHCSNEALYKFISNSIKYPDEARKNGIEGRVVLQFIVEANGELSDIKVINGVSPELDQEALRVMNTMNKWIPGYHKGKAVAVAFTLPIKFVLDEKQHNSHEDILNETRTVADVMPRFPGCEHLPEPQRIECANAAMYKFIGESIMYPKEERQQGIEGIVVGRFVIDEYGSVVDPEIVRGVSPALDEEVLRVIDKMKNLPQKWIPGRKNGQPVSVMLTVPVKFVLDSEKLEPLKTGDRLPDLWGSLDVKDAHHPVENSWITIRPNPASDNIEIEILEDVESIRIAGISGLSMWEKKNVANQTKYSINVSNWQSGKYIVYLFKDGISKNAGFLVQN